MAEKFIYPNVRRDETVIDNYHGTEVPDPYAWLEDPDGEETQAFVEAQNKITMPYLEKCAHREKYKKRLTEMWDYPKYGCPFKRGPRYFYNFNTGLQNQSVMYVQDSLDSEAKVFIDPNKLSEDGTVALTRTRFSEDGEYCAFMLSSSGSDWNTIKFKKVATNEDLTDVLERVKFSCLCWTHDGKGVFYNSYPQDGKTDGTETTANLHQKLFYHVLGTKQSEDVLCGEFPDNPKWMMGVEITDDGLYAVLCISEGCDPVNRLYYCDLSLIKDGITGMLPYVKLVDNFDAEYEYIANEGALFTFKTNLEAPNYKLITIDFDKPEQENWKDLIPESETDVLEWVACVNKDKLVVCYIHDVKNILQLHSLQTGEKLMTFPLDVGTIRGYSGRRKDAEMFYQFTSFLTPGVIYHCDMTKEALAPTIFKQSEVKGFDRSKFETVQVFIKSKDGTKVPVFLVHRKGIQMDGNNPVFLYGYGGFNISIMPMFSASRLVFMQQLGGILAVANLRGGGEYGEKWHKSGSLLQKQNVFDDFQCAAEYLINAKYTQPSRIVINGGSNGGTLVGACMNQRPDLFCCAVAQVGVMDMLKFHKFTIGHAWTTDFGCSDKKEDFENLKKYSPLHNIQVPESGEYPSTLLLTADHDDRVVPLHSLKYIANLQHIVGSSAQQTRPLLIRVDTKAGHGAGKPTTKVIEECADIYAFIAENMNLTWQE